MSHPRARWTSASDLTVVIPTVTGGDKLERARAAVGDWPVEVVRDERREGFAATVNRGLARASSARVLVLNDDAAPKAGCVEALLAVDADLVGPVLVAPGGTVESAGIRFSERSGRVVTLRDPPAGACAVDALSGACLLMPGDLRFDPGYPHGFEDVALARAVRRAGGRVVLQPAARCVHLGGATRDRRSPEATRDALIGHLRLVGPGTRRAWVTGYAVLQVLREGADPARLRALLAALRA